MTTFNRTVLKVELGINEKKVPSTAGAGSSSSAQNENGANATTTTE
jgi:hypothetical protein